MVADLTGNLMGCSDSRPKSDVQIHVREFGTAISIETSSGVEKNNVSVNDFPSLFIELLIRELTLCLHDRLLFRAAAVQKGGAVVLIPGASLSGKTMLAAWMAGQGCTVLSDGIVVFSGDLGDIEYLSLPMKVQPQDGELAVRLLKDNISSSLDCTDCKLFFLKPSSFNLNFGQNLTPGIVIFPRFVPGQAATIKAMTSGRACLHLLRSLINDSGIDQNKVAQTSSFIKTVSACELTYGNSDQLTEQYYDLINFIAKHRFLPSELNYILGVNGTESPFGALPASLDESIAVKDIPSPTPLGPKKRLTVGMATFDDYDGVYFTVQAIRMYHQEILECIEIIVVDNNPGGPCSRALKDLDSLDGFRYIPFGEQSGTAVRDQIFRQANSDYVLSIDCHVLIVPGALKRLIEYFETVADDNDLLQGPLLHDSTQDIKTHMAGEWRGGMYGVWASDERGIDPDSPPFEIPMHGLGLFACKREAWPGFNPRFRGFGGEEGYIHQKIRNRGGRVICLPFLRWLHRFPRPLGVPYPLEWQDRIFNYMVGFSEVGWNQESIKQHFTSLLGEEQARLLFTATEVERASPFFPFDAIYCITIDTEAERWKSMRRRLDALGIGHRVRVFKGIETPNNHHIGCTLSHRSIIAEASRQQLENVLVFEDDALFLDNTLTFLKKSIEELAYQQWNVFYLGGYSWGNTFPLAEGCTYLRKPVGLTCTHALAYHSNCFAKILEDIPASESGVADWLPHHGSIDQYLRKLDGLFLAEPVVATQPYMIDEEDESRRARFTLGQQ